MLIRRIIELGVPHPKLLVPMALHAHSETCPASKPQKVCPGAGGVKKSGGSGSGGARPLRSGKCRMGFIPNEWFLFFRPITGVSGPYFFILGVGNYLLSKEIYVMEHEYYLGLSIFAMAYYVVTRHGASIGAALDKEVDAVANEFEKGRKDEMAAYQNIVKDCDLGKWRAEGQKNLMDAKKENIAMQLEAIYRERIMMVYQGVRGRMDYHVKKHRTESRIQQKWMIDWILKNVRDSITPEFKKQAMDGAIKDLIAIASRPK